MMGWKEKMVGGEEYDFLTKARNWYTSDKGRSRRAKKGFIRRIRRMYKQRGYDGEL